MALGKLRDPKKESFWRRMVRRQAGSALSVRGWCAKHDLREATFYWWRAELAWRDAELGRVAQHVAAAGAHWSSHQVLFRPFNFLF